MARTQIATDDFNRADGSLGSNWGDTTTGGGWGAPAITSNTVGGGSTTADNRDASARWIGAGTFDDDQYSEAVIVHPGLQTQYYRAGVIVRASADQDTARDHYAYWFARTAASGGSCTVKLVKVVNGTWTVLDETPSTVTVTDGDTIALEVEGSTLRGYIAGVLQHQVTDTDLTTGRPGIMVQGTAVNSWAGGDVTPDGTEITVSQSLGFAATVNITSGSKTATLSLKTAAGAPAASLTGLKWAWWDYASPNLIAAAPVATGASLSTDANGVAVLTIGSSALTSGQIGFLVISDTDGTLTQSPVAKAFAGPVAVD